MKPKRCPYLEGDGEKRYEGIGLQSKEKLLFQHLCSLRGTMFNGWSKHATTRGCLNGEYVSCETYSKQTLEQSLAIPLICPVAEEEANEKGEYRGTYKCPTTGEYCDLCYEIEGVYGADFDYRKCEIFSQWFWEKAAKEAKP